MQTNSANSAGVVRLDESGQAATFLLLVLGIFLLGGIGLAVDMANMWFHRQSAQNAADAACTAAAMDLVNNANGATNSGGFTPGTAFNCSSNSTAAPCQYAAFNGYAATTGGLQSGSPSVDIAIGFPTSVSGVQSCSGNPPPSVCTETGFPNTAFVSATVTDRMQSFFIGLLSGRTTMDTGATARCGAVLANAPIPILVLDPRNESSLTGKGNIAISIVGGPQRSIQVDALGTSAVSISGGSGTIDLRHGGPNNNGSDFGVTGNTSQVGIFTTNTPPGAWIDPTASISDPFATIAAPGKPADAAPPSDLTSAVCASIPCVVANGVHGCPDTNCYLYTPGHYSSDICVGSSCSFKKQETAIFDPGIYYLDGNLTAVSNSCLRPSTAVGDGSGGTMFYFAGTGTVAVGANAGTGGVCPTTQVSISQAQCIVGPQSSAPGSTGITVLPANVITANGFSGNVLLGPCQAAADSAATKTSPCTPNCGINYGDPLTICTAPGSCTIGDPLGEQRGMLFFQNRSVQPSTGPSWSGGGAFGLAGNAYFHYCSSSSGGTGANCDPVNGFMDQFTLGGGSANNTFIVGDIITDQLYLHGNPNIEMDLNPNALYYVLKASLLQ